MAGIRTDIHSHIAGKQGIGLVIITLAVPVFTQDTLSLSLQYRISCLLNHTQRSVVGLSMVTLTVQVHLGQIKPCLIMVVGSL